MHVTLTVVECAQSLLYLARSMETFSYGPIDAMSFCLLLADAFSLVAFLRYKT